MFLENESGQGTGVNAGGSAPLRTVYSHLLYEHLNQLQVHAAVIPLL